MNINTKTDQDQLETLKNAITPDHHSRAAYVGRLSQTETVTLWDESGQAFEHEMTFPISWETISQLLQLIAKRANIQV